MNAREKTPPSPADLAAVIRAIQFAMISVVLVVSYFNIHESFSIPKFQAIYHDMLGDEALPVITVWVINCSSILLLLSIALPVIGIGTLFMRNLPNSFHTLGGVLVLATLQAIFLFHALSAPLLEIVRKMSEGAP